MRGTTMAALVSLSLFVLACGPAEQSDTGGMGEMEDTAGAMTEEGMPTEMMPDTASQMTDTGMAPDTSGMGGGGQ